MMTDEEKRQAALHEIDTDSYRPLSAARHRQREHDGATKEIEAIDRALAVQPEPKAETVEPKGERPPQKVSDIPGFKPKQWGGNMHDEKDLRQWALDRVLDQGSIDPERAVKRAKTLVDYVKFGT